MENDYRIELIEEHSSANFYSLRFEEDELSEMEKFFKKFPFGSEYDEDIDIIISWLDKIGERGALERYFRPEGRYGDGISAIPIETNKLRLYCIRLSDKILIFGNGGVKDSDTWQNSETLKEYVKILIKTKKFLVNRIRTGKVILSDKEIYGDLNFAINEKK